jgi:carbamoyltransferase
MVMAFRTTPLGKKHLRASIHPYDKTIRPQILEESVNPSYYRIIKEFERLTGIGAVLNTSFNLHGEPIVCSPQDAIHTFLHSGLEYLAMGNFLVEKKYSLS